MDYRVTHKFVKNRSGKFRPTWQTGDSPLDDVAATFAERMSIKTIEENREQDGDVLAAVGKGEHQQARMRFGPRKVFSGYLASHSGIDQANNLLVSFEKCYKGFKALNQQNLVYNKAVKDRYDHNPRSF